MLHLHIGSVEGNSLENWSEYTLLLCGDGRLDRFTPPASPLPLPSIEIISLTFISTARYFRPRQGQGRRDDQRHCRVQEDCSLNAKHTKTNSPEPTYQTCQPRLLLDLKDLQLAKERLLKKPTNTLYLSSTYRTYGILPPNLRYATTLRFRQQSVSYCNKGYGRV